MRAHCLEKFFQAKKRCPQKHFRLIESSRSVEVKLGEMALTSKLEHLKAHGPLSHYRSLRWFIYISWREVFGRIFLKGKQVAQKSQRLGIVWGDPSESES